MKRLLPFLFFLVTISLHAQWQRIHPANSLNRFMQYGRIADDGNTWVAVGNDIATSANQGASWNLKASTWPFVWKPDMRFTDIIFVNDNVGFLIHQQTIYKTVDGGQSWVVVLQLQPNHTKYQSSAYFNSIAFVDELTGYAVGDFEKVFRTADGGNNWEKLSWTADTSPFISYTHVSIGENNEIRIGGYEVSDILMNFGFDEFVATSTDAVTWERSLLPSGADFRQIDVHTTGHETFFVHLSSSQLEGEIYYTSDNGAHWNKRTPPQLKSIRVLECLPTGVLLAWGEDHSYRLALYRSDDFGESWTNITTPLFAQQDQFAVMDFVFQDATTGFTVGAGGAVMTTSDAGESWMMSNAGFPLFLSFDMINDDVGFASSGTGFFRTDDGGASWNFMAGSDSLFIYNMQFESTENAIFYGWRNFHYRLSDNAAKIEAIKFPVSFLSLSSALLKGDSLFVSGRIINPSKNVFLKSGDRGETWTETDIPNLPDMVTQIKQVENKFYFGFSEGIRRCNSKGEDWQVIADFDQNYMLSMIVIDAETIVASFGSGEVKRSVNSGVSWQVVGPFNSTTTVKDFVQAEGLIFAYGSEIIDGGSYGKIWRSSDNGATWQKEELPLCDNFISDMDIAGDFAYATGGFGMIFKIDLSKLVTEIDTSGGIVAAHVYPVPASYELRINVDGDLIEQCSLTDIAGRRVILPFERVSDSSWKIDITAVGPGVYVIHGQTSSGRFQKRFVISR